MSYEKLADGSAVRGVNRERIKFFEDKIKEISASYLAYAECKLSKNPTLQIVAQTHLESMIETVGELVERTSEIKNGSKVKRQLHDAIRALYAETVDPDDSIKALPAYQRAMQYFADHNLGVMDQKIFLDGHDLNPFDLPPDYETRSPGHKFIFWLLRSVELLLWPVKLIGWLVRNAVRAFFFALRHPKFWQWGNVNDRDADLNPAQLFIKQVAKGFDDFLEMNFELVSRPLDVIEAVFKFLAMDKKWEKIKAAIIKKFEKQNRVSTITTIVLIVIQIGLSIALPVTLLAPAAGVAATAAVAGRSLGHTFGGPGVGCVAIVTAAAQGASTTAAVAPALSSFSSVANLCSHFDTQSQNEVEELEQALELLYKNLTHFSQKKYQQIYEQISEEIVRCEEKLSSLKADGYLNKRDTHIADLKETVGLFRKNLTSDLAEKNPKLYKKIQTEVEKYDREIEKYESTSTDNFSPNSDFVWIKSEEESSFANRAAMFSEQHSNNQNSNNDENVKDKSSTLVMKKG